MGVLATVVVLQQFSQHDTLTSELDGSWKGVRWEGEDGKRDDLAAVATRLTIAGDKLMLNQFGGEVDGLIATDATQRPKTFDAAGSKEDVKGNVSFNWVGIYEREGDALKLCFVARGKGERPKEFKANPAMLLILRRDKQ